MEGSVYLAKILSGVNALETGQRRLNKKVEDLRFLTATVKGVDSKVDALMGSQRAGALMEDNDFQGRIPFNSMAELDENMKDPVFKAKAYEQSLTWNSGTLNSKVFDKFLTRELQTGMGLPRTGKEPEKNTLPASFMEFIESLSKALVKEEGSIYKEGVFKNQLRTFVHVNKRKRAPGNIIELNLSISEPAPQREKIFHVPEWTVAIAEFADAIADFAVTVADSGVADSALGDFKDFANFAVADFADAVGEFAIAVADADADADSSSAGNRQVTGIRSRSSSSESQSSSSGSRRVSDAGKGKRKRKRKGKGKVFCKDFWNRL